MSLSFRDANGVEQGIAGTPYDVIKDINDKLDSYDHHIIHFFGSSEVTYKKITFTSNSYTSLNLHITDRVGNIFDLSINANATPQMTQIKVANLSEGLIGWAYKDLANERCTIIFKLNTFQNITVQVIDNYETYTHFASWTSGDSSLAEWNESTACGWTQNALSTGQGWYNGYNLAATIPNKYPSTINENVTLRGGLYIVHFVQGAAWGSVVYLLEVTPYHVLPKLIFNENGQNVGMTATMVTTDHSNPVTINIKTTGTYSGTVSFYRVL